MDVLKARQILGVGIQEDERAMKIRFRQMIRKYHPDMVGSDLIEFRRRAQEINEAYHVLKKHYQGGTAVKEVSVWTARVNPEAFTKRSIYIPYSHDETPDGFRQKVAEGKYMWEPEEEEFADFMRSIAQVVGRLLADVENGTMFTGDGLERLRFVYQKRLVYQLALEFIDSQECLEKLLEPEETDPKGRKIYRLRAFLSARRGTEAFRDILALTDGENIWPEKLRDNRIFVRNSAGKNLGYLSFEDDALYFCIIPLLKAKKAQIKMQVYVPGIRRRSRPEAATKEIRLWLRVTVGIPEDQTAKQNQEIHRLLQEYREMLRK